MVFQDYALYPHLSVRENLEFPLRMRGVAQAERAAKVERVAGLLALGALLERAPRQLSGGERQRVAMGRALVREPAAFLLDEPLSNLDAKLRVQLRAEIAELRRRAPTTMLYVTHDQVEALTLGDRVAVLERGRLQQVATPAELYARPANRFVAGFIGSPPMNFLDATVNGEGALSLAGMSPLRPAPAPSGLATHRGRVVTLGVRPEDLALAPGGAGAAIPATLEVREPLGNESLLYWKTPAGPVVSRVPGDAGPVEGETTSLHFRYDRVRWFDPTNGEAIE